MLDVADQRPSTEVAVFAANDEYEPSLLDIVAASEDYHAARDSVARGAKDVARDEAHYRESVERLRELKEDMHRARLALLRATGAVLRPDLAQEV